MKAEPSFFETKKAKKLSLVIASIKKWKFNVTSLIALAMLASCTTYQRCLDKYGSMDSTVVVKVDTIKFVRPVDSIRHVMDTSHYVVRETERTKLVISRDTVICMAKADTVHHYERTVEIREKPVFQDRPRRGRLPWWTWGLVGVIAGLAVALMARK